jgi:hypothetical protein
VISPPGTPDNRKKEMESFGLYGSIVQAFKQDVKSTEEEDDEAIAKKPSNRSTRS